MHYIDIPLMVVALPSGVTKIEISLCECGHMYAITESHDARAAAMDIFGPEQSVFVHGPNWARCPKCQTRILLPSPSLREWQDRPRARLEGLAETAVASDAGFRFVYLSLGQLKAKVVLTDPAGREVKLSMTHSSLAGMTDDEILAAWHEAWEQAEE